jgi:hypothetical protein
MSLFSTPVEFSQEKRTMVDMMRRILCTVGGLCGGRTWVDMERAEIRHPADFDPIPSQSRPWCWTYFGNKTCSISHTLLTVVSTLARSGGRGVVSLLSHFICFQPVQRSRKRKKRYISHGIVSILREHGNKNNGKIDFDVGDPLVQQRIFCEWSSTTSNCQSQVSR